MDTNTFPKLFEERVSNPLISSFENLTDTRMKRGIRYHFKPLMILLFLSKLGGADTPAEIADWVTFRFTQLKQLLSLGWPRSPHEATWKRFYDQVLEAVELEAVIGEFLRGLSAQETELLNLDGKCLRSTIEEESTRQLHLLALHESEENLTVGQTALAAGENEISAAKRLLKKAVLKKKIVSGDAMFAQQELAQTVVGRGGEYLWKLRANQGGIYEQVRTHFEGPADRYVGRAKSLEKGHGRLEEREIVSSFRLAGRLEFPYLAQVFRITRKSAEIKSGRQTEQQMYGVTSLPVEEYGAAELLDLTRKHWRIENGLHYRRDVTFKEDKIRKKSSNGGQVMAALNNLAIGILRKAGWENLAKARRYYAVHVAEALELILQPLIL